MAEMMLLDSINKLRALIDRHHLLYLELDESQQKIDQLCKLESCIKEYLCIAPHDAKFSFHQTAEVLHRSACTKNNFSAYKAALAWKGIGKYADNLISHPWRKEYRNIKLYCGFYKHEISESLIGAELMFEAMGYRHTENATMTLQGVLDPDTITSVSKDAIMAYVECQIMKHIWEALSCHFHITWLEILEFRENHTGTPDQVIRALTFKYREKQYQEQIYQRQIQSVDNHHECFCGQPPLGYYNQSQYTSNSYPLPIQNRYGPIITSQQVIPPCSIYPPPIHSIYPTNPLKSQDVYSLNGHQLHAHYPNQTNIPNYTHNGYLLPMKYPVPSVVPTGQLIELDSSPSHNPAEPYPSRVLLNHDHLKNEGPSLTSKAKDDGAGSWENWDYVYKNLENHGYKKSFEPAGETSSKGKELSSSQNNSSEVDLNSLVLTDVLEKMKKVNIYKPNRNQTESCSSKSHSDGDEELRLKTQREKCRIEGNKSGEQSKSKFVKTTKTSPDNSKREVSKQESVSSLSKVRTQSKGVISQKAESISESKDIGKSQRIKNEAKPLLVTLDNDHDKWQCVTCTFLNLPSKNVCEMCFKSKERGSELKPQPSGGQECPKCTLVNEPGLTVCIACDASLKDSPTYI